MNTKQYTLNNIQKENFLKNYILYKEVKKEFILNNQKKT